ncbi:MAG: outer membrane protein assembly factor BamA [Verrucomicrobia bacterium]|nr:outer membrane protein assembly factor BamA [Verrucomicrobiota bacterium]
MKAMLWLCALCAWVALVPAATAQPVTDKITRIEIKHIGPADVSETLIRANIRSRAGEDYLPATVDDDVRNLYAMGLFYNIRVSRERDSGGIALVYIVQAKPRLTDIKIEGNDKLSLSKIKKKITSKVGEPLDERKLFSDTKAIEDLYQKNGYPGTKAEYKVTLSDDTSGRGTATIKITESPKIKIRSVEIVGAKAFSVSKLRKEIKTRRYGMWSWLTRKGYFKNDEFEEDQDKLKQFYREKGYIDFEIQDIKIENPKPNSMVVKITIFEGKPYKVGAVTFQGTTMLPTNAISPDYKSGRAPKRGPDRAAWIEKDHLNRNFRMKPGDTFTESGLSKDLDAVKSFYDSRGHIDVGLGQRSLNVRKIPNTESGTMDLRFDVDEGQKSFVEKIEIRGNTKTKDKVIRRELAISPGELFDMTRVNISKQRLENLGYFAQGKVMARPEATSVLNRKDLIINVEEKETGKFTIGAGLSSESGIVGFAEATWGNFDLFHPPYFNGAGQKLRLAVQLGTQRQDYQISFHEPWFLDRKLDLGVDLYHTEKNYQSLHNLYDELRSGMRLSLAKTLGSDFLIGSVSYTLENVGINLDKSVHGWKEVNSGQGPPGSTPSYIPPNAPSAILDENGASLQTRLGAGLAWDTRNSNYLPDSGQRSEVQTELTTSALGGVRDFYKIELQSAWYFKGLSYFDNMPKGHVLEVVGRGGVADGFGSDSVPFYDRWYLGGQNTLRGYSYRSASPREAKVNADGSPTGEFFNEPVGGNSYWFGSLEYSVPIIEKDTMGGVRIALFYDIGKVNERAYDFGTSGFNDNWGIGLRLNLPIGPLRLDYGIPIHHDKFNGSSGKFQFGVGYSRPL